MFTRHDVNVAQQSQIMKGSGLVTMEDILPSHPNPLGASSSPVPIQSYTEAFFFPHPYLRRRPRAGGAGVRRHVSPRCRLGHTSVRVGGRHTLAAPPRACARLPPSFPSLPGRTSSPLPQPAVVPCLLLPVLIRPPSIPPSAAASPPVPTDHQSADQDPSRLR